MSVEQARQVARHGSDLYHGIDHHHHGHGSGVISREESVDQRHSGEWSKASGVNSSANSIVRGIR